MPVTGRETALTPRATSALRRRPLPGDPASDATLRVGALDAAADHYLDAERVASTREAYARDWAAWEDYTRWAGIPLLSGGRGALVGFEIGRAHV